MPAIKAYILIHSAFDMDVTNKTPVPSRRVVELRRGINARFATRYSDSSSLTREQMMIIHCLDMEGEQGRPALPFIVILSADDDVLRDLEFIVKGLAPVFSVKARAFFPA